MIRNSPACHNIYILVDSYKVATKNLRSITTFSPLDLRFRSCSSMTRDTCADQIFIFPYVKLSTCMNVQVYQCTDRPPILNPQYNIYQLLQPETRNVYKSSNDVYHNQTQPQIPRDSYTHTHPCEVKNIHHFLHALPGLRKSNPGSCSSPTCS